MKNVNIPDFYKTMIALEHEGFFLAVPTKKTANASALQVAPLTFSTASLIEKKRGWYIRVKTIQDVKTQKAKYVCLGPYTDRVVEIFLKPIFAIHNRVLGYPTLKRFVKTSIIHDDTCKNLFAEYQECAIKKIEAIKKMQYETAAGCRDKERPVIAKIIERLSSIISEKNLKIDMKDFSDTMLSDFIKRTNSPAEKIELRIFNKFVRTNIKTDDECKKVFAEYEEAFIKRLNALKDNQYAIAEEYQDKAVVAMKSIILLLNSIISKKSLIINMELFDEETIKKLLPKIKK